MSREIVGYECLRCGESFGEERSSHGVAGHDDDCDGSCENCPVELECGPIEAVFRPEDSAHEAATAERKET